MIFFCVYEVYQIVGDEDEFNAPIGLFSDADFAKFMVDRKNPQMSWTRLDDPDNLRIMWYGYEGETLRFKIVPFALNSLFCDQGEILALY